MTSHDLDNDFFADKLALADEYVLGVLDQHERKAVQTRMIQDRELRAEIELAETRFSPFAEEVEAVKPPAKLEKKLQAQLFGAAQQRGFWHSLFAWRSLAGACAMLAIASVIIPNMYQSSVEPVLGRQLIASLEGQGSDVKFLALYETADGTLKIRALSGATAEDQTFELWLIEGDQGPKSLGVLSDQVQKSISIAEIVSDESSNLTFAISLEPAGGSPTGSPTGPVLAAGQAIEI